MWVTTQLLFSVTLLLSTFGGGYAKNEGVARKAAFGRRLSSRISQSPSIGRNGKSLARTFPFNRQSSAHHHDHDDHHHAHNHDLQQLTSSRGSRQGASGPNDVPLDIGSIAAAGERCIDKVVMVSETEYDDQVICKHSYSERCHVTYKTDYEPQQEEECNENYRKKCYIDYKNVASEEKVQFCFTPLVRNCDVPGPEVCSTEYRSECTTRFHEHEVEEDRPKCEEVYEEKCEQVTQGYSTSEECTKWPVTKCSLETSVVKKYTPETDCKKVPFQLCGPSGCPVEPGAEQCFDKTETVVQEVPEETCTLEPQKECKQVTKLVPLLKPAQECVDIPKEVCVRQRTNPRRIQKPIIKKWCYTPKEPSRPPITDFDNQDGNQGQSTPSDEPQQPQGCIPGRPVNYCPTRARNGVCDPECNNQQCGFDGGDCRPPPPVTTTRRPPTRPPTRPPPPPTRPPPQSCNRRYPADYCPKRAGNGRCDPECNTRACGNDGGDCVQPEPPTNGYLPPAQPGYTG